MEINKPTKTTYFICRNEKLQIKAYGIVKPNQVMTTTKSAYLNIHNYERKYIYMPKSGNVQRVNSF